MKWMEAIADVFMPRCCHLCGASLLDHEQYLCEGCLTSLPATGFHKDPANPVVQRLAGQIRFERAAAVYFYERGNQVSVLVHDFKYHGYASLAQMLGKQMGLQLIHSPFFNDIDAVTYVPLHWSRHMTRGYNQAQMLALGLSEVLGVPCTDTLSARRHISQTRQSLTQRTSNPRGKYSALPHVSSMSGQHLLLVDDVCTTGATLIAACRALLAANSALRVSMLTLAATL